MWNLFNWHKIVNIRKYTGYSASVIKMHLYILYGLHNSIILFSWGMVLINWANKYSYKKRKKKRLIWGVEINLFMSMCLGRQIYACVPLHLYPCLFPAQYEHLCMCVNMCVHAGKHCRTQLIPCWREKGTGGGVTMEADNEAQCHIQTLCLPLASPRSYRQLAPC